MPPAPPPPEPPRPPTRPRPRKAVTFCTRCQPDEYHSDPGQDAPETPAPLASTEKYYSEPDVKYFEIDYVFLKELRKIAKNNCAKCRRRRARKSDTSRKGDSERRSHTYDARSRTYDPRRSDTYERARKSDSYDRSRRGDSYDRSRRSDSYDRSRRSDSYERARKSGSYERARKSTYERARRGRSRSGREKYVLCGGGYHSEQEHCRACCKVCSRSSDTLASGDNLASGEEDYSLVSKSYSLPSKAKTPQRERKNSMQSNKSVSFLESSNEEKEPNYTASSFTNDLKKFLLKPSSPRLSLREKFMISFKQELEATKRSPKLKAIKGLWKSY